MAETALAEHTETAPETPPASRPDYSRLSQSDIARVFALHKAGLTQTVIAQQIGCSQRAVSKWLQDCTDTTDISKFYLRGQALSMARNIVKKGRAADHVAVLKGLSVLEDNSSSGLVVQIGGGSQVQVNVQLSPQNSVSVGEGVQKP
jgi:DNA-binding transcriptional regulator YiaG